MSGNYCDESGAIMINWQEAMDCIAKLSGAEGSLRRVREGLKKEMHTMEAVWQGDAKKAFDGKATSLCGDIDKCMALIDQSKNAIHAALRKYDQLDNRLAFEIWGGV